jgi:hypothetical protein
MIAALVGMALLGGLGALWYEAALWRAIREADRLRIECDTLRAAYEKLRLAFVAELNANLILQNDLKWWRSDDTRLAEAAALEREERRAQ